jgi:hypothetical protein
MASLDKGKITALAIPITEVMKRVSFHRARHTAAVVSAAEYSKLTGGILVGKWGRRCILTGRILYLSVQGITI